MLPHCKIIQWCYTLSTILDFTPAPPPLPELLCFSPFLKRKTQHSLQLIWPNLATFNVLKPLLPMLFLLIPHLEHIAYFNDTGDAKYSFILAKKSGESCETEHFCTQEWFWIFVGSLLHFWIACEILYSFRI